MWPLPDHKFYVLMLKYLRLRNISQVCKCMTQGYVPATTTTTNKINIKTTIIQFVILELKWIVSCVFKHSHDFLTHPFHLGLSKLHYIITDIVQQCNGIGTQSRLHIPPHLVLTQQKISMEPTLPPLKLNIRENKVEPQTLWWDSQISGTSDTLGQSD